MTDSITIPIPADVLDNSPYTVRVTSRDTRDEEGMDSAAGHLASERRNADLLGYTVHEFDTTDLGGHHVTITWLARRGRAVWLYETSYYTRVACARCPHRWAQVYVVIEQDGWRTKPEPLCGDHWSREEIRVNRSQRAGVDLRLHRSDWLRIGQH